MIGRLNRSHEFQRLRSEGTRVRSGFLWCVMLPDSSLPGPQVAFAIGRPFGSAVRRNRLRRQLRAILTTRETELGPGMFLIGVNSPSRHTPMPSFTQLSRDVEGLLTKGRRR
ncbi:MAG: ribonuclease P protein component [Actinomycetota bacterium]